MTTLDRGKKVNPIALVLYSLGILVIVVGLINSIMLLLLPEKFVWWHIDLMVSNTTMWIYSLSISFSGLLLGFLFIGMGELVRLMSIAIEKDRGNS